MNFSKKTTLLLSSVIAATLFFTTSIQKKSIGNSSSSLTSLKIGSIAPLMALTSVSTYDWSGVRGVASLIKGITDGVNDTLNAFRDVGVFQVTTVIEQAGDTNYFKLDPTFNTSVTGPLETATYQYSFEVWTDSSKTTKALEFFFNDPADNADGVPQVYVIMNPTVEDATVRSGSMLECQTNGTLPREMVCRLGNDGNTYSLSAGEVVDKALVYAQQSTDGSQINFEAMASTVSTSACSITNTFIYSLAFIANTASPNYSTAIHSLQTTGATPIPDREICGSGFQAYPGFFNVNVNPNASDDSKFRAQIDSETPPQPADSYPAVADVEALFTEMQTASHYVSKSSIDAYTGGSFTAFKL